MFGETVQTKLSKPKGKTDKYSGDWKTGIWLGRDSETNEHLVSIEDGSVIRSRTVRRFPTPDQFQLAVYRTLRGTLWNIKEGGSARDDYFDPSKLLPLPPVEHFPKQRTQQPEQPTSEAAPGPTADPMPDSDTEMNTVVPDTPDASLGKRTNETTSGPMKRLRIAFLATVQLKDGTQIEAIVNEDMTDFDMAKIAEIARHERLDPTKTLIGMKVEIEAMQTLDVFDLINLSDVPVGHQVIGTRWVLKEKGDGVRARLVAQGYNQELELDQSTYASTPQLVTLKFLCANAVSRRLLIKLGDISTAFLHAVLKQLVYCHAPSEIYGEGKALQLKRALYGLKNSPLLWQEHLAECLTEIGFTRLKTDANLYVHHATRTFLLVYVDDVMFVGEELPTNVMFTRLQ